MSINNLESKVFQDEIDFKTFENILETLDNITPKKVSRHEFNEMRGDFLVETGEDKFGKKYDLFLPDDLKVFELPAIISKINKLTFGEILPDYASKEELKVKVTITINTLLQVLSERNLDENQKKDIQRAIKKYVKLFEDLYGNEESQKLNDINYRNEIIEKSKLSSSYERFNEYQRNLEKVKTKEKLDELLMEVEEGLSGEIQEHFDESFFEKGVNMLRIGMLTISQVEQKAKIMYNEKIGFESFSVNVETKELDENERLLREKIGIDNLKYELWEARKSGNQTLINNKEFEATNRILKVIHEFPYISSEGNHGYKPKKIQELKEIYCVGYSILGHAFLSELGIKHYGLDIPRHSALEVIIGDIRYYFDATGSNNLREIHYGERVGKYYNLENIGMIALHGNPEMILLSQIYNNTSLSTDTNNNVKEKMREKVRKLNPNYEFYYIDKGDTFKESGNYDEAIKMYEIAIGLNPKNPRGYENKGDILRKQGLNKEAEELYNIAINIYDENIEKNPDDWNNHDSKGIILEKMGDYPNAFFEYNQAISINPNNGRSYLHKSVILEKIGFPKLGELHEYTYKLLMKREDFTEILYYRKEKQKIKELITSRNYEGLRLYLLELEKEEK